MLEIFLVRFTFSSEYEQEKKKKNKGNPRLFRWITQFPLRALGSVVSVG